jgi:hypothetical protein
MHRAWVLLSLLAAGCAGEAEDDFLLGGPKADRGERIDQVPYKGGPVLHAPKQVNIYWGGYWRDVKGADERRVLDQFTRAAARSDWYDTVLEYGDAAGPAGRSVLLRTLIVDDPAPPADLVSDRALRTFIEALILGGTVPWDPEAFYVVFTPPRVTVSTPWGRSCEQICGYHHHYTAVDGDEIRYAVIPYLYRCGCGVSGASVNGSPLDAMTSTLAHEIAEVVTDPDENAWTSGRGVDEIADLCEDRGGVVEWEGELYVVQDLWSNATRRCVR